MPATLRRELARKAIHLASAVVPVAYAAGLARGALLAALGAALLLALAVERARRRPAVAAAFARAVGPLLRPHEHARLSGATWMALAYLLAALLFPRAVAVAAMLAVALGDAAAAIVGRWAAARRAGARATSHGASHAASHAASPPAVGTPDTAKSWLGSLACFAATAAGASLVAGLPPGPALACALAAALAERPRGPLDDNVRVALAAGAAGWGATWLATSLASWLATWLATSRVP